MSPLADSALLWIGGPGPGPNSYYIVPLGPGLVTPLLYSGRVDGSVTGRGDSCCSTDQSVRWGRILRRRYI